MCAKARPPFFSLFLCIFLVACIPTNEPDPDPKDFTDDPLTGNSPDRPANIMLPAGFDPTVATPIVFVLGGYFNLASELDDWINVSSLVDELGFILVLPNGTIDPDEAPFWNATDTCCDYYDSGVDDVGYLSSLLDEAKERFTIDTNRVIYLGHSNGAFMGYRMACQAAGDLTALVSIAGSSWLDEADCEATHPISVLQVHLKKQGYL